jgi:hypothetical protein
MHAIKQQKVPELLNLEPKVVARFVAERLHARWQSEDDPVPFGDVHDFLQSIVPLLWM